VAEFKDRIFHVHAKDSEVYKDKLAQYGVFNKQLDGEGTGYWQFRMPGLGQVDFAAMIKALKQPNHTLKSTVVVFAAGFLCGAFIGLMAVFNRT
jgi:sugar phosphate isomerase/epimerase